MRKTRQRLLNIIVNQLKIHEQMGKAEQNNTDFNNGYHSGAINALKEVLLFADEKTIEELWQNVKEEATK